MFDICRDDFIYYLRQGKVSVLGSVTGIEGVYTVQGTSNGIYMRGNKKRVVLGLTVKAALENILFGANNETYISNYIPKLAAECADEEKDDIATGDDCKLIFINSKGASIKFDGVKVAENKYNQFVVIGGIDEEVRRCIQNTSYGNADKSYRTTYYYGGTIAVYGKKYVYVIEGLELINGKRYIPKYFIVYTVEVNNNFQPITHSSVSLSHVEEELNTLSEEIKKKNETDDVDEEEYYE